MGADHLSAGKRASCIPDGDTGGEVAGLLGIDTGRIGPDAGPDPTAATTRNTGATNFSMERESMVRED
jgi:hypothetical protein